MKNEEVFTTMQEALEILAAGKMLILVDDEGRENEGDLVIAAEKVTPESINFMITEGKGLVCCAVTGEIAKRLGLEKLKQSGSGHHHTNFLMPVDASNGTSTGISAFDRAETVHVLSDPDAVSSDLVTPGHLFPLEAVSEGVLERQGHTEAVVELCRLSGTGEAGVICEIINSDGTMARRNDLVSFAAKHGLKILAIRDIVRYLTGTAKAVKLNSAEMPTEYGLFRIHLYRPLSGNESTVPFALSAGDLSGNEPVLVRIHSECLTGDLLGSKRCDCGDQFAASLKLIQVEGRGILVYLRQEGRGIGLVNKISAYNLQQHHGMDTVEANEALGFKADERSYLEAAAILKELGVEHIRLLTNNPDKMEQLKQFGIQITERVPLVMADNGVNSCYLETKKKKMGHLY